MCCQSRPRLPSRLQFLESRLAPAIVTQAGQSFTDTEILVGIRSDDPLFHLTGRVVTNRWSGDIDIAGSSLMFRQESTGIGIVEARLQPGVDPLTVVEKLRGQPGIEFAEVNRVTVGDSREWVPNDPLYAAPGQWHIGKMQVDKAWDISKGTGNIVVAVLDDGQPTAFEHEDLTTQRWKSGIEIDGDAIDNDLNGYVDDVYGWDFVSNDNNPSPVGAATHGTQVSGIIAATNNNGLGVSSVAGGDNGTSGVRLMSVRIYGGALTVANLAAGMAYAVDNGAKIINISYNIDSFANDMTFKTALDHVYTDRKALAFISAGNNNTGTAERGRLTEALFVANTQQNDARFDDPSYGSNFGTWVDLAAPGTGIVTTFTGNSGGKNNTADYQSNTATLPLNTGTSFAAPNAAGVAALIWSKYPTYSRDQVATKLLGTADNIDAANPQHVGLLGTGRVNAYRALTETLPAPKFGTITGLPADGGITSSIKAITITAPWRFEAATVKAASFELRGDGPDDVFGNGDDTTVGLTVDSYQMGSNEIVVTVGGVLTSDKYRFTAKSGVFGLRNPFGAALDGNGDGVGGDAFEREFVFAKSTKVGGESDLNSLLSGGQFLFSDVGMAANGDYAVVFAADSVNFEASRGILLRRFGKSGNPLGSEYHVNSYQTGTQSQPRIAMDDAGNFVVVWESQGQDGSGFAVVARRFDSNGWPMGPEFIVNEVTTGDQNDPAIAMNAGGEFVISWTSNASGNSDVFVQRYSAMGMPIGSQTTPINSTTLGNQNQSTLAIDDEGDAVVAWAAFADALNYAVFAQFLGPTGLAIGNELTVSPLTKTGNSGPAIAMDADGDCVVTYSQFSGPSLEIFGKRFDRSRLPVQDFAINTYTTGVQDNPRVSMTSSGDFTVVWHGQGSSDVEDIQVLQFNRDGERLTPQEFRVNTTVAGGQRDPSVAVNNTGQAVVTWTDSLSTLRIRSQRLSPATTIATLRPTNDTNLIEPNERMTQPLTTAGLTISFSGAVNTTSSAFAGSATNPANYVLTVDGKTVALGGPIVASTNPSDNISTIVTIPLTAEIPAGHVVLTIKDAIVDPLGNRIDGDGIAAFGGDFMRAWDVVAIGKVGPELPINTNKEGQQNFYDSRTVATDAMGNFWVVWADNGGGKIAAQRFNAVGSKIGGEIQVNTNSSISGDVAVAVGAGGDAVIVWGEFIGDVFGQRFDAMGGKVGNEFIINTYTTERQTDPSIAMDAAGGFVVAWSSLYQDGSNYGVYAQRFDPAGNKIGGEMQMHEFTTGRQEHPSVAMDADGDAVVVWDDDLWGVAGQRIDATGKKVGNGLTFPNRSQPSVAVDADGNAVVVGTKGDGAGIGIFGQRYDAAWQSVGPEIQVNTYTTNNQLDPAVALDADGDAVVVWRSTEQDGSGYGIYGQRFNAAGTKVGTEFRLNTYTTSHQGYPSVALDPTGDIVAVWTSYGQDGSSHGIFGQRLGANSQPTTTGLTPISIFEDTTQNSVNLVGKFSDGEGGTTALSYSVVANSNPAMLKTAITNGVLEIETLANLNGPATLSIRATTLFGLFVETPLVVTVLPVNDPPAFVKGPDITVPTNYSLQTYPGWATQFSPGPVDEQGQAPSYEIISNTNPLLFSSLLILPNGTFQYDPTDEAYGTAIIGVRVRDSGGTANGGIDVSPPQMVALTVVPDYFFGYVGPEVRANATTTGSQKSPAIAVDADGDTVVVWTGNGSGDADGIFGQRYNAQGKPLGNEFRVNTTVAGVQNSPAVAATNDGRHIVVWAGSGSGDADGIFAQRYLADGTAIGGEFRVNTTTLTAQSAPAVAIDLVGNFVMTWDDLSLGTSDIKAQRFDVNGNKVGAEFAINVNTIGNQSNSRVRMASAGQFVAAFGDGSDIYYRRFAADGTALDGNELIANYYTTGAQTSPDIGVDADADFVITWSGVGSADPAGIFARRFGSDGKAKDATDLAVNVTTTNSQSSSRISIDADGDFAITWTGYGTSDPDGVFVRRFFSDGTSPDAKGQRANAYTSGVQNAPTIAMDHDGEFVVAWTSAGQDGNLEGIYQQRFGYPLPPVQTKTLENPVVLEDGADTVYYLFDYFSSATGKSEAMEYTIFSITDPSSALNGVPTIDSKTGELRIRYAANRSGTGNITVRVRDTTEVPTLATLTFTVIPVNDAPVLGSTPLQVGNEGNNISFSAVGSDPNDVPPDNLTYSLIGAPVGATINPTTGQFTWTPADGPATVSFTVRVTDDGKSNGLPDAKFADRGVTINVNNIAPSSTGLNGPGSVLAGKSASFALSNVSDAPGDISTLKYSFDWTADGIYDLVNVGSSIQSNTFSTPGTYTVKAKIADKDGASAEYTTQVIVTSGANNPPKVQSVQVNDGSSNQRSRVSFLTIAFNSVVDFAAPATDAFELSKTVGGSPVGTVAIAAVDTSGSTVSQTIAKITFTGGLTQFGSLVDGNYSLRILASKISAMGIALDGNGDGTAGDDYTGFAFHRLFGDADGNGTVTAADFNAFRLAYGSSGSSIFDFNGDNQVSASDFNEFRTRYGVTI